MTTFPQEEAAMRVHPLNFLDLDHHAYAILRLLGRHNLVRIISISLSQYRIVCMHLAADVRVHAGVTGSGA